VQAKQALQLLQPCTGKKVILGSMYSVEPKWTIMAATYHQLSASPTVKDKARRDFFFCTIQMKCAQFYSDWAYHPFDRDLACSHLADDFLLLGCIPTQKSGPHLSPHQQDDDLQVLSHARNRSGCGLKSAQISLRASHLHHHPLPSNSHHWSKIIDGLFE